MKGLITYLAGPGRHNEHRDQHVVAGSSEVQFRFSDIDLDKAQTSALGACLDTDWKTSDTTMKGGHVWHCSLAISREDGVLSDDEWQQIAHEFITKMGFDDAQGTKGECRWVAIRHGLSGHTGTGNDHVHLAVNLIRSDGTKAWIHHDYRRAQQACRELEHLHGLEELGIERTKAATRGWKEGEREAQARRRARAKLQAESPQVDWGTLPVQERKRLIAAQLDHDQPRYRLAVTIRTAAAQATTEAEFIRRLRGQGILVRPRFAKGSDSVVTGYSVAHKPLYGESPTWYGAGTLARDLRLPRLRQYWPDSIADSQAATDEWQAAFKGRRVAHPQVNEQVPQPEEVSDAISRLNHKLRSVPLDDRQAWASVAHEVSGAFASWSRAVEQQPGPLADAARQLSRTAQTYQRPTRYVPAAHHCMMSAALVFSSIAADNNAMAQAILYRQLWKTVTAIHAAMEARHDAYQARILKETQQTSLTAVAASLPAVSIQKDQSTSKTATLPLSQDTQPGRFTQATPEQFGAAPIPYRPPATQTRGGRER
ncbi:relaxase/mobilization nuclease domain-containing protein [Bifidobacterium xylocopae]|uniref:relaxase/mobilization nuclease domain-containing protein n=1 Tax=Bifidobacterium xylocopae TaxID=2493119 RepID=UPI001374CA35|nr:relaxase/mobilization nuclease domain-containing protein [Bifidobacterium xylocopae]